MKEGRRNKEFAAFCAHLPFNIVIKGYEGSFSGCVRSMAVSGTDIAACSEFVVLETSINNLDIVEEDVTMSLGFSKESWFFY